MRGDEISLFLTCSSEAMITAEDICAVGEPTEVLQSA